MRKLYKRATRPICLSSRCAFGGVARSCRIFTISNISKVTIVIPQGQNIPFPKNLFLFSFPATFLPIINPLVVINRPTPLQLLPSLGSPRIRVGSASGRDVGSDMLEAADMHALNLKMLCVRIIISGRLSVKLVAFLEKNAPVTA